MCFISHIFKMRSLEFIILCLSVLAGLTEPVNSARILVAISFPGKSHYMMSGAIIRTLIEQGHEITAIVGNSLTHLKLGKNYTEVLVEEEFDYWKEMEALNLNAKSNYDLIDVSVLDYFKICEFFGIRSTEIALRDTKVQKIINAEKTEGVYDLLIAEQFYQEAFLALGIKYNIPVITYCTLGTTSHMSQMTGIITPWSFVPNAFYSGTDKMNFFDRLENTFYSLYEDLSRQFYYLPQQEQLVKKYFKNLPSNRPTVHQMEQNISILLLNNHPPLRTPRPKADTMIDVGGMHIYPSKPLPVEMQKFLDEAEHGAIYFSLGSNVQSKDMPEEMLNAFLEVFNRLPQRVLWKFEDDRIKSLPANIMVGKWMPQNDILAHPNVKAFITHGGLFGTQEGVYHGVPMLGIPFYCDQHLNVLKATINGYAVHVPLRSISVETLETALRELIYNPKYKANIMKVSTIFRDRPMSARDTVVYWVDYVLRHKGAYHLRSAGNDLNIIQFYLLDVIGFLIMIPLIMFFIVYCLIRSCFKKKEVSKKEKRKRL